MNAYEWLDEYLDLCGSFQVGQMRQCPAHDDSFPSLSVSEGEGGSVLLFCHAGCTYEQILESLSLPARSLFEAHTWTPGKVLERLIEKPYFADFAWKANGANKNYDYRMKHGNWDSPVSVEYHQYSETYRLKRMRFRDGRPKQCIWEHFDGITWRQGGAAGILHTLPLYKTQLVVEGIKQGRTIILCESESSVDALVESGFVATTWAGGCSRPQIAALNAALESANVVYVADNDPPGLKCLGVLSQSLGQSVNTWTTIVGEPGEDARDLLAKGALGQFRQ